MPRPGDEEFIVPLCAVLRRHLRDVGQKFTSERAQVLETIIRMDRVFEAEELFMELRRGGMDVSKATVYRTLKLIQEAGIIEHVYRDEKQGHYRLAFGRAPNDQIVCVDIGKVIDFADADVIALRDRIAAAHGVTPVGHRFQIFAMAGERRADANEGTRAGRNG